METIGISVMVSIGLLLFFFCRIVLKQQHTSDRLLLWGSSSNIRTASDCQRRFGSLSKLNCSVMSFPVSVHLFHSLCLFALLSKWELQCVVLGKSSFVCSLPSQTWTPPEWAFSFCQRHFCHLSNISSHSHALTIIIKLLIVILQSIYLTCC